MLTQRHDDPQVDLSTSSIRPGREREWLRALKTNTLAAVEASNANITVHTSNWMHDLDQVRPPVSASPLSVAVVEMHALLSWDIWKTDYSNVNIRTRMSHGSWGPSLILILAHFGCPCPMLELQPGCFVLLC